jgi:hypothetical protein
LAVVTDAGTFTGWNIPMTRKHSPATMADKPAKRMRVDVVIFVLLSLIEIFPLVFISISPFLNQGDKCQNLTPGIAACLVRLKTVYE